MSSLREEKADLRARMKALRDAIPPGERTRMSAAIEDRLMELPAVAVAHVVLLFWTFGSEVATRGAAARLVGMGRRVLLPYLVRTGMEASELRPGRVLVSTAHGPMEPEDPSPVDPVDIDLVVAPGLAFDREGNRVGYGGGHFDRYLARLRADAMRVGVAFHQQIVSAIPHGRGDQRLDVLVTDLETIVCPPRQPKP